MIRRKDIVSLRLCNFNKVSPPYDTDYESVHQLIVIDVKNRDVALDIPLLDRNIELRVKPIRYIITNCE